MEEEKMIEVPYYETAYIDENNNRHLAFVKNEGEISLLRDRFTILDCHLVTTKN